MSWITINYRPGFSYDLTSWHTEIHIDGEVIQTVEVSRFSPVERKTLQHRAHLTAEQVSELVQLIAATDFAAIERAARHHVIDDAEEVVIAVESHGRTQRFSAPLLWWHFSQQRGEFSLPELEAAVALWKAIDRFSPYGLDHRCKM